MKAIVLLMLLALPFSSFAVNKCKIDGKTVYQDAPCPSGSGGALRLTDNRVASVKVDRTNAAENDSTGERSNRTAPAETAAIDPVRCEKAKRSFDITTGSRVNKPSTTQEAMLAQQYEDACGLPSGSITARLEAAKPTKRDSKPTTYIKNGEFLHGSDGSSCFKSGDFYHCN